MRTGYPCEPPKTVEIHVFRACPPKGGSYQYHQNLTNRPKPFKNLVKMNNSTVRPCATSSPVRSGSWRPRWIPRGAPSKNIGIPCVSEGAPLGFHWRHQSAECRPDQYHQSLTNRPKPFKNLVKKNNSTVWSPPAATQRRSGSRHARSERELRAKCVTWKTLKTIGKRCFFSMHHRCISFVTMTCCAPKGSMCACVECMILHHI